jgi:hypothetical protein
METARELQISHFHKLPPSFEDIHGHIHLTAFQARVQLLSGCVSNYEMQNRIDIQ